MEKENKKAREDHRKEYNDVVRSLTLFIQHRDPRYHAYQRQRQRSAGGSKASNGGGLGTSKRSSGKEDVHEEMSRAREAAAQKVKAEKAAEMAASAQAFTPQSWQRVEGRAAADIPDEYGQPISTGTSRPTNATTPNINSTSDDDKEEEDLDPTFECVACNKLFSSEKTWQDHERSKKHKQAVWRLKKEMLADQDEMDLLEEDNGVLPGGMPVGVEVDEDDDGTVDEDADGDVDAMESEDEDAFEDAVVGSEKDQEARAIVGALNDTHLEDSVQEKAGTDTPNDQSVIQPQHSDDAEEDELKQNATPLAAAKSKREKRREKEKAKAAAAETEKTVSRCWLHPYLAATDNDTPT